MAKTLNILAVGDPAVDVYVDPKYRIIENYTNATGIDVNFDIIPFASYYSILMGTFEGKHDYDVVMVAGHLWSGDFVKKGFIKEVSFPQTNEYDKNDILPVVREELKFDGKDYLYPSFCDGHIILYRKSILQQVLKREFGKVVSADELISAVKAVHGYEGMSGIVLKAHPSEIFLDVLPYIRDAGSEVFDNTTFMPVFNNEKAAAGIEKYLSLRAYAPVDTGSYGNDEVRTAFQKRKTVFAVTWGGQLGTVMNGECEDRDDIGFATFRTPWNVTWSFAINSKSQKIEEANAFLASLSSKETDRIVGSHAGSPVRASSYETDKDKYNWYSIHLEMIRDLARPMPKMPDSGEKLGYLYEQLTEAFKNNKTVRQALQDAETAISKIDKGI